MRLTGRGLHLIETNRNRLVRCNICKEDHHLLMSRILEDLSPLSEVFCIQCMLS